MHLFVRLAAVRLCISLAASSPECGNKVDDVVSLLQLSHAHEVQKGASETTSHNNPFLMRAGLVNKIENLKTWYNAKLASLDADLAALDARFPGLSPHKNGSNATNLVANASNATIKYWWEYLLPPNYHGPVPARWVPAAMRHGYQPWRDNAWKWLVYGNLAGHNKTMYQAKMNAYNKGALWPDPYGPFWGQGWKFWLPLVLTAKKNVEAKAITLKRQLDEEGSEEKKVTLHKRLVESAGELSELTSKFKELSTKAEGKETEEEEVQKSDSDLTDEANSKSSVESDSESTSESQEEEAAAAEEEEAEAESPLGLSAPEIDGVRTEPAGEDMLLESAGSEKEQMQEESSPLGLGDASEPNPEPAAPRQAGIDAPPILENAPTMSEAEGNPLGGSAGSLPDWPDIPGPLGSGDADFEAMGSTEADAYMGQSQYGGMSQAAGMAQSGAMADVMAGASDGLLAAAGDVLAAGAQSAAMMGAQNAAMMGAQNAGMAGAQNGMMAGATLSKSVKGSMLSGPHPAIPDAYLGAAMKVGYDPVRDTAWQRMLGVNLKQNYHKDGEKKEGI